MAPLASTGAMGGGPHSAAASATVRAFLVALLAQAAKLTLLLAAGHLLPDYDTSASMSWAACSDTGNAADARVPWGWHLVVWDSVYMARIACHGYEYEQQYAFFPLLPAVLRALRRAVGPRHMALAGLLLSGLCAALSAALLHRLTLAVTRHDRRLAAFSALAWTFSAASPFTTGLYTESLFAALTLLGLCTLYCPPGPTGLQRRRPAGGSVGSSTISSSSGSALLACSEVERVGMELPWLHLRLLAAGVCFGLASCARSNGVVNAGFVAHGAAQAALRLLLPQQQAPSSTASVVWRCLNAILLLASGALAACVTAAPLLLHQLHAHATLCLHHTSASTSSVNPALQPGPAGAALRAVLCTLWAPAVQQAAAAGAASGTVLEGRAHVAADVPAWCSRTPAWWPAAYTHVQERYWDVGLLRYWRLSQVPNFLLAMPVLALSLACIATYARHRRLLLLTGGFAWGATAAAVSSEDVPLDSTAAGTRSADTSAVGSGAGGGGGRQGAGALPVARVTRSMAAKSANAEAVVAAEAHTGTSLSQATRRRAAAAAANLPSGGHLQEEEEQEEDGAGFLAPGVAVFVYPLAFSTGCALLVMHVQVATRFLLSSSPALFWYAAHVLASAQGQSELRRDGGGKRVPAAARAAARWMWAWSWSYALLGSALFANFYPWT